MSRSVPIVLAVAVVVVGLWLVGYRLFNANDESDPVKVVTTP